MQRYIECNNIVFLAVELELGRVVALMAVEDQQSVCALHITCCVVIKVFNPV